MTAGVSGAGAPPPPPSSSTTGTKAGGKAKRKTKHTAEKPKTGKGEKSSPTSATRALRKLLGLKTQEQKSSLQLSAMVDIALANPNFLSSEGILRLGGLKSENEKALKSPEKYFKKNANSTEENRFNAMASALKAQVRKSFTPSEKILLALMAGVKPDELKQHLSPEQASLVNRVAAQLDAGSLSDSIPPGFMIIARLCHEVANNPSNKMNMQAVATCMAPNLTPDVTGTTSDPMSATNFIVRMNTLMGNLMTSLMTGTAPATVSGTDSIYAVVNPRSAANPLYRRMTTVMSIASAASEPDVVYASGLQWKTPDGKAVTLGGVDTTDSGSDSDSDRPSGSGGAAGSSSAARPAADPDTSADGRGDRGGAGDSSTASPYSLRPRTAAGSATTTYGPGTRPKPLVAAKPAKLSDEDKAAPAVPPRTTSTGATSSSSTAGVTTRSAEKRKKEEEKAQKKAEKKAEGVTPKKPVISSPIMPSDSGSSSESSSASPTAKRKLIMPISTKPAPPHPSRTDDSTGESTHLTRDQIAALRKQIAEDESSSSSSSSSAPSPVPDTDEPTHMSFAELRALAGQSSKAQTSSTDSGMMTRSKAAAAQEDSKSSPTTSSPSRPTPRPGRSNYASLDELEAPDSAESHDDSDLFDEHGFRLPQPPSPVRHPHTGPGPKTGEIYSALGPKTHKASTSASSTEPEPATEDTPAPALPPRGGVSGQSSTSASSLGVVTRSKAASAPSSSPAVPFDPSMLKRSSPVISGGAGVSKPKPLSEPPKEAPKRGRSTVKYPEAKATPTSPSGSPVRKKPVAAPSTSTGAGSSSSSSPLRPMTRSSAAASSSVTPGASTEPRRPLPAPPSSEKPETELERAFRLRREKKQ